MASPTLLLRIGKEAMHRRSAIAGLDANHISIPGAEGSQTADGYAVPAYPKALAKPQIEPIARTLLVNREVLERVTIPSKRRSRKPNPHPKG